MSVFNLFYVHNSMIVLDFYNETLLFCFIFYFFTLSNIFRYFLYSSLFGLHTLYSNSFVLHEIIIPLVMQAFLDLEYVLIYYLLVLRTIFIHICISFNSLVCFFFIFLVNSSCLCLILFSFLLNLQNFDFRYYHLVKVYCRNLLVIDNDQ